MIKIYLILFFSLLFNLVIAQNEIILIGKVYDVNSKVPLEYATVYFSTVKDSTILEYTNTDKEGAFKINTKKIDQPIFLKVSFVGYPTFTQELKSLLKDEDFGKLYLAQNVNTLNEIVIKSEAPPIRVKKDTLEFNAKSFKTRPDASVELLLKQLPGFEVDNNSKITVNGKEVTQFLVNGKPFFNRDGLIALKNLPADVISKIQVSDFKTKKEELAKQESTSDFSSINLTIDEKKNRGYFGKFLAGYGSDDRFENSFIVNYFSGKQKISVLGALNNINASGFSQDDVFDSMSGGRNTRQGNSNVGNSRGITTSKILGVNYTDEWFKDFESSLSHDFSNTVNRNTRKSTQVSLLPTGSIFTSSDANSRSESTENKVNAEFEYRINSKTRLVFTPRINQNRSNNFNKSNSSSTQEDETLLNESVSISNRESTTTNFDNSINFNKVFEKKMRNLSVVFNSENRNNISTAQSESNTTFYQGDRPDDVRNQNSQNSDKTDRYAADIEYTEPITDSIRVRIGAEFDWSDVVNDLQTFDFDTNSQSYINKNILLSIYTNSVRNSMTPKVGLTFDKNKFSINLSANTSFIDFNNAAFYLNKLTQLNQQFTLPFARAQIRYRVNRLNSVTIRFEHSNSLPSINQLLPVANLANPLNTIIGNQDLNPNQKNSFTINFRNFNTRSNSGYNVFMRADFFNSEVVSSTIFDSSGKRTSSYQNVTGTFSTSMGINWNQTFKKDAHVLRYGFNLNGSYDLDKGFTNNILFDAKSLVITPRAYFSYDFGEILNISPSYNLTYSESQYTNSVLTAASNVVHNMNIQVTNYIFDNWIFGNDFGYNYNSNISDAFKKDFYLWNTSLSYSFYDKKMLFKVKVYDVLDQNQSVVRTISPTSIRDEENTVLTRYAMFSLVYKIGNFGGSSNRAKS